jgi:hypothetical protein
VSSDRGKGKIQWVEPVGKALEQLQRAEELSRFTEDFLRSSNAR